jgi:hypothetical protein
VIAQYIVVGYWVFSCAFLGHHGPLVLSNYCFEEIFVDVISNNVAIFNMSIDEKVVTLVPSESFSKENITKEKNGMNCSFQDLWAAKFPWVEFVL